MWDMAEIKSLPASTKLFIWDEVAIIYNLHATTRIPIEIWLLFTNWDLATIYNLHAGTRQSCEIWLLFAIYMLVLYHSTTGDLTTV